MSSFWNVPFLECALFGMCLFWNELFLECAAFGMRIVKGCTSKTKHLQWNTQWKNNTHGYSGCWRVWRGPVRAVLTDDAKSLWYRDHQWRWMVNNKEEFWNWCKKDSWHLKKDAEIQTKRDLKSKERRALKSMRYSPMTQNPCDIEIINEDEWWMTRCSH